MKILIVNIFLDAKSGGGTAERTLQLIKALLKLGQDCKVLALDLKYPNEIYDQIKKAEVTALPCINKRYHIPKLSIRCIASAVKNVDVIHLMNHWSVLNTVVYFMARLYKKPYVICPAGSLFHYGRSQKLKKLYDLIIGWRIVKNASYCIAVSQNEYNDFYKYKIDDSKIVHIPNGINEIEYPGYDSRKFRIKYKLSEKNIILFVGRLNSIKGIDLLIKGFGNICDQIPEYQLVVAGPDEGMRDRLEIECRERNLYERVTFVGFLDSEDKASAYNASSLLVIPSRREAMSIVVLEAGIHGVPALITKDCGFDEIEKVFGGMAVETSVSGLERGLMELLKENNKLTEMGKNLKKHVQEKYLWSNIAKEHIHVFNNAIKFNSNLFNGPSK